MMTGALFSIFGRCALQIFQKQLRSEKSNCNETHQVSGYTCRKGKIEKKTKQLIKFKVDNVNMLVVKVMWSACTKSKMAHFYNL